MKIISKYKFATGKQIKTLADFSSLNTCDRRLRKLIEAGYIQRKYFIYGVPALYFTTKLAQDFFNLEYITSDIRIDKIKHEVNVTNTAIYFINHMKIPDYSLITERELKHEDGFCRQKHRPDFIYNNNQKVCVEVEMTEKSKERLERNIRDNYLNFDTQYWIVSNEKIKNNIQKLQSRYTNIEIIELETIKKYIKSLE